MPPSPTSVHATWTRAHPKSAIRAVGASRSGVWSCSLSTRRWYAVRNSGDTVASNDKVEAEQLAACTASGRGDAICQGDIEGHSHRAAHHPDSPFQHGPCADRRVLESCAQATIIPLPFVESAQGNAAGRCSPSYSSSCRRVRRRAQRARNGIGRARQHPCAPRRPHGAGWPAWCACRAPCRP